VNSVLLTLLKIRMTSQFYSHVSSVMIFFSQLNGDQNIGEAECRHFYDRSYSCLEARWSIFRRNVFSNLPNYNL